MTIPHQIEENVHIAVIGGGITGLSAAWEIQKQDPTCRVTVLESSPRLGGKIQTHTLPSHNNDHPFISDAGPESFVTRKTEAWVLANELGLADQVKDPGSETRGIFVLDEGIIHPVPLGPGAFFSSKLMSTRGKLRLLAEPFISAKADDDDESLAEFAGRRLGHEATEKFIGPILGGIYNANPEKQSILTTSPIMREMESEHGSLVKALVSRMRAARKNKPDPGQKRPRFMSFAEGAERLITALNEKLDAEIRLNTSVTRIERNGEMFQVYFASGDFLEANAVILATTANVSSGMLADAYPEIASKLQAIRHENAGTIALTYKATDISQDLNMTGLMIPRREGRNIDAVQWTSTKLPDRAPEGYALLRVFFGGSNAETVSMTDEDLLSVVRDELRKLLEIDAAPLDYAISRWPDGFPQADVGHLDRIGEIEETLPAGMYLAGSSYRGVAVPDCIRQGRAAGAQALGICLGQVSN